jgi:hypothetical protein
MATKRRKTAPRYAVNISLKAWDIAKAGAAVTFKVRDRDGLLGTIEIGQGTFGWKSARGKKGFKRIAWSKLATYSTTFRAAGFLPPRLLKELWGY